MSVSVSVSGDGVLDRVIARENSNLDLARGAQCTVHIVLGGGVVSVALWSEVTEDLDAITKIK